MDPFSIFFVYFLRNSNVFYPSIAFIVITKDNFSCEQKSGFLVNVKHEKSVKVFLTAPNGRGDCATGLLKLKNFTLSLPNCPMKVGHMLTVSCVNGRYL